MQMTHLSLLLLLLLLLFVSVPLQTLVHGDFMHCMSTSAPYSTSTQDSNNLLNTIYPKNSTSYTDLLRSTQQNPRWVGSESAQPLFIVTPTNEPQVRAAVLCSRAHGLQVRVRSGGHDYEGLSYLCTAGPFIIIDLINLRSIDVNVAGETAWVHAGATLGELYYAIGKSSKVHGFPAGLCPSVGVGGHFSGGGIGTLHRKYGTAADNVIDARIVDASGKILDRKSMGEDLFWAIRGGGGASFGVITAWKIKLVRVPPTVTVSNVYRSTIEIVDRWQYVADKLPRDLFIRAIVQKLGKDAKIQVVFNLLFLGKVDDLMPLMARAFPELGLNPSDCKEMSWIDSVLYFTGYQKGEPKEVLLDRKTQYKSSFKAKSDHVEKPIPTEAWRGIWERFIQEEQLTFMIMDPYGGKMDEVDESETPFPYRKGYLYNVQYLVKWDEVGPAAAARHVNWIRELYSYMAPYVSKSPRTAYLNYRDLDLGVVDGENSTYLEASFWGEKYFKGNFKRLSIVKRRVDPDNFFRNEQSVPPYSESSDNKC